MPNDGIAKRVEVSKSIFKRKTIVSQCTTEVQRSEYSEEENALPFSK